MSKKKRKLQMQKRHKAKLVTNGHVTSGQLKFAEAYFSNMYGELLPLTDELIESLIATGWDRKPLIEARAMGFLYSKKRNSLVEA